MQADRLLERHFSNKADMQGCLIQINTHLSGCFPIGWGFGVGLQLIKIREISQTGFFGAFAQISHVSGLTLIYPCSFSSRPSSDSPLEMDFHALIRCISVISVASSIVIFVSFRDAHFIVCLTALVQTICTTWLHIDCIKSNPMVLC